MLGQSECLSPLNSSFTSAGPCMHTATWFPVFKLPPCSPLRFPPHPDLSRDEIFPYFPGFRHSLIHRFKREWGWLKKRKEKKRKKREEKGKGEVLWLGACSEQNLLLFCIEKLETRELLIPCCKAGNTDTGNGAYQPSVSSRISKSHPPRHRVNWPTSCRWDLLPELRVCRSFHPAS